MKEQDGESTLASSRDDSICISMAASSQSHCIQYTCLPYTRSWKRRGRISLLCKLSYTRCARCSRSTLWLYANKFLWEYIVWERRAPDILFRFMSSYEPTRDGEIIPREGNCTPRAREQVPIVLRATRFVKLVNIWCPCVYVHTSAQRNASHTRVQKDTTCLASPIYSLLLLFNPLI